MDPGLRQPRPGWPDAGAAAVCSFNFDTKQGHIQLLAKVERPLAEDKENELWSATSELAADFIFGLQTTVGLQIRVVASLLPVSPLAGGMAFLRG